MIRLTVLVAAVMTSIVLWNECGEDFGVFCYRIGLGAFATLRSRTLVPVPVSTQTLTIARNRAACSNRSAISSTRFMTSKD
jgi:hypothetical protein